MTERAVGAPETDEEDDSLDESDLAATGSAESAGSAGSAGPSTTDDPTAARWSRLWAEWRRPLVVAAGATVGFRLIVTWIALVSADGVQFPHVVARHPGTLSNVLYQWDGSYYLGLAAHGYPVHAAAASVQTANRADYAFGPLYPLLIRLVHDVTGISAVTSAEVVSTLGLFVALLALWKLVDLEAGTRAADGACILLLAWPSAFFLVATYPESVTLAVGTLAFLCVRRGHFVAAGLLAAAATIGKYYLVLLVLPLALEVWVAARDRDDWRWGRDLEWLSPLRVLAGRLAAVVVPTVAVVLAWILYEQAHFGQGFAFLKSQAQWHRHISWPWTSIGHAVSDIVHLRVLDTSTASIVELFDLVTVVLIAIAAVVAFLRIRPSYGVLLGLVWCVFTFQTILLSESREVLVLFPFFAVLGVWVAKHQWRERALLFLFLPCGYFLLERFVTAKFAG